MTVPTQLLFQLPHTFTDRLALGEGEIRIPATLAAYFELAEECDYKVEYSDGEIVSMGSPTDAHEKIIINFGWILNTLFSEDEPYEFFGSNLGVYIPENGAHYRPDLTVLNAPPEYITHKVRRRHLKSVLNPFAVVEVFSDGSLKYDMAEKLPNYKQCPFLKHIILVDQHRPFVSIYTRSTEREGAWLSLDYDSMDASFDFEGREVLLRHIYRKVIFGKKKK